MGEAELISDMNNIFDEYNPYELRQIFTKKDWPKEFKNAIHEEIAYDLLDSWLETVDEEAYKEKIRDIIENLTYGYEDDDGNEMTDFVVNDSK